MTGARNTIARTKQRFLEWSKERAPWLHRFLTSDSKAAHNGRSFAGFATLILLGVALLWGGTGQPFGEPPVVVIESGSMMHCDNGGPGVHPAASCDVKGALGLGTIDPGDLVFVRDIDDRNDVHTMAEDGKQRHGSPGDVIVFRPDGSTSRTPVIHRAMFYVEFHGDGTVSIEELGVDHEDRSVLSSPTVRDPDRFGLSGNCHLSIPTSAGPEDSGWVTKGDNNRCWDQSGGHPVSSFPIREDWVLGKARGELPWVGLLKLWTFDLFGGGTGNYAAAPGELRTAMWVSVGVLLGAPYAVELVLKRIRKDDEDAVAFDEIDRP